eukprot:SAG11_NODE_7272_length_1167_cov_346.180712_2_plen_195_part_00
MLRSAKIYMDDMLSVLPFVDDETEQEVQLIEDELYNDTPARTRSPLHEPPIVMVPVEGQVFVGQKIETAMGWYLMARLHIGGADKMMRDMKRPSLRLQPHHTYMTRQQKLSYINIFITLAERRSTFATNYYDSLVELTVEFGLAGWPLHDLREVMRKRAIKADDRQKANALRRMATCITKTLRDNAHDKQKRGQ